MVGSGSGGSTPHVAGPRRALDRGDLTVTMDAAAHETERLAALRRYDILDTPPEGAFDRVTALAADLFHVPIAIVSLVDEDRIWFKSHHGLETTEIDRAPGLCASAILHDGPWVVNDARHDPRSLANPLVASAFGLQFYAGVPLRTHDGYQLGTMCILDFEPRALSDEEVSRLGQLAAMVMGEMELRLASRRAAGEVRERETLTDAFVGMLSHELRTPITTIVAAAHLLAAELDDRASERSRELIPDIAAEADRLMRLIEDLLVLTRAERGSLDAETVPVLLQRILPPLATEASKRASCRPIRLELPADLPPVTGDQIFVEQVVTNLISNALKYSGPEMMVDVSAAVADEEVEVRVRDRGIGLDASDRERVFDLLVRTDAATSMAQGAGIGLYVCRRLVTAMAGRIWVEAAEGGGSVFAFRLPIERE